MSLHVILSHSSADEPAVEELARLLKKEGIEAWLGQIASYFGRSHGSQRLNEPRFPELQTRE
jgi:hypothetical protein